jgi:hypothetical protein
MINVTELAEKIFGTLKGFNCHLKLFDNNGNEILSPINTRRFYSHKPNLMVHLDEVAEAIVVTVGQDAKLSEYEKLQQTLRSLANQYMYNYQLKTFGKSLQPKDFSDEVEAKKEEVKESFSKLHGRKYKSYQTFEDVKIHLEHSQAITDTKLGERTRNIKNIFVESNGENFQLPVVNLNAARAIARHIHSGGHFKDEITEYICNQAKTLTQLKEFVKYAKINKLINEGTADVIFTVKESIQAINNTFKSLIKPKSYSVVVERIKSHDLIESNYAANADNIKDMFTVKLFDSKLESILPYINTKRTQRQKFIEHVTDISTLPVPLTKSLDESLRLLEYTDKKSKLYHSVTSLKDSVKDNSLKEYLEDLSKRITDENVSKFDVQIVENILSNMFVSEDIRIVQENKEFSVNKYLNKFLR